VDGDFRVGDWLVQPQTGNITKEGQTVSLEPKVMEVLVYLVQHAGEVLPKEKIIRAVWRDSFVSDEVLTNAVSALRRVFGDDPKKPRFIETLPRRGYRIVSHVVPTDLPPNKDLSHRLIGASAGLVVLVVVLGLTYYFSHQSPVERSLAVIPFINDTQNPELDYLSYGISEGIAFKLAPITGLRLISPDQLGRYKESVVQVQVVSQELNVEAVLSGDIQVFADRYTVHVRLHDGLGSLLWGKVFAVTNTSEEGQVTSEVQSIQRMIALEVVDNLGLRLRDTDRDRISVPDTTNDGAFQALITGNIHFSNEDLNRAKTSYELAVRCDPEYSQAHLGLANVYYAQASVSASGKLYRLARRYTEKSLELDPKLANARVLLASFLALEDRDWLEAEKQIQRAKDLNPNLSSPFTINYLCWTGNMQNAIREIVTWSSNLDRLSAVSWFHVAGRYYWARAYDLALAAHTKAKELNPENPRDWLAEFCFIGKGMEQDIFEHWLSGSSLSEEEISNYKRTFQEAGMEGVYRLDLPNQIERMEKLKQMGWYRPYDLAAVYAQAGTRQEAFEWLETTYELPYYHPFVTDARFDSLRDDPRYVKQLRKLNLPEEAIARHMAGYD
jgi:DNA-binding winged helix-turn-helix (wHTH) protein/TolB-like protein